MHEIVLLDIDGTLCENGHYIDWSNPVSVRRHSRPIPAARTRLQAMLAAGWAPCYLTGRHAVLNRVTHAQLSDWFGPAAVQAADILTRTDGPVSFEDNHHARVEVTAFKAEQLVWVKRLLEKQGHSTFIYVGDTLWDKEAAGRAGWTFMWAHEWRRGDPWPTANQPRSLLSRAQEQAAAATSTGGQDGSAGVRA